MCMKKTIICLFLMLISILSISFGACAPGDGNGNTPPVANAELDEYNQIVNQMKSVFTQNSTQPQTMSANFCNSQVFSASSQQTAISTMFAMMEADSSKKETMDMDYYAYGIDFSTMTARIAGYAANNFFRVSSFYDLNFLMDYGGSTVINACVKKEENVIKTYLFTTFNHSQNQTFKEYNYAEINFTSQDDFYIIVIDYAYDEQDNIASQTLIYASSDKEFFLLSGDAGNANTNVVFFDRGEQTPAYMIQGAKTNTIENLLGFMSQNFALSNQDKTFIGNLYNAHDYSISYKQVTEAKTDLGIIINMEDEEYVPPVGFVSNKNAEDLVGRKTLQAFVDDGESVEGTTLTIPNEFNYLSGGIYFDADIDTLVIPSTIQGVVVYDRLWNYSILDDSLCYYEAGDEYDEGRYRAWGGTLFSYLSDSDGGFGIANTKPFKKYILLDDNGQPTQETDAFVLDEIGNLWIKDSNGNKNYLWGFVSEPSSNSDTIYLPSPTYVTKDRYIEVEHFACQSFLEGLKNIGKLDEYTAHFKHAIIDGYVAEQSNPETGVQAGFKLLRNSFFVSFEYDETGIQGCKWDLETLTINNIIDGAIVSLTDVFCSESNKLDEYGYPTGGTVCQAKVKKVILNGDFNTITFSNGYCEIPRPTYIPGGDGIGTMIPDGNMEITATYAISEEYQLNGREGAYFSQDSTIYGKKVVEIYGNEQEFPVYPDAETLLIKSSVEQLGIYNPLLQIGVYPLPEERKLTIEFENIAGINFSSFYINDLMNENSTRVEKIKFNVSELYMANLIENLEWNPSAGWLDEVVNSGKYEIEFAEPLPGEQEFLTNFSFQEYGYVYLKESSGLSTIEINDDFLSLVKQITGKELSEVNIEFWNTSGTGFKILLNVSETFLEGNNGQIPSISGGDVVEISSEMKALGDLTLVLDRINPNDGAKLIFNGTKQELIACSGTLGLDYITRLLYIQYGYYGKIDFSDNETLYRDIDDKVITYEDERIRIVVIYGEGQVISYSFEDKLNSNVSFDNSNEYVFGNDDNNSWCVCVNVQYNGNPETSIYNEREVIVPVYNFSIYYQYGHLENGDFNYVYGTYEQHLVIPFKVHTLSSNIKLS